MVVDQLELLSQERQYEPTVSSAVESSDVRQILDSIIVESDDDQKIESPIIPLLMRGVLWIFYTTAFAVLIGVFWSVCTHITR